MIAFLISIIILDLFIRPPPGVSSGCLLGCVASFVCLLTFASGDAFWLILTLLVITPATRPICVRRVTMGGNF